MDKTQNCSTLRVFNELFIRWRRTAQDLKEAKAIEDAIMMLLPHIHNLSVLITYWVYTWYVGGHREFREAFEKRINIILKT